MKNPKFENNKEERFNEYLMKSKKEGLQRDPNLPAPDSELRRHPTYIL